MKLDDTDPPRIGERDPEALLQFVRGPLARGPSDAAVERMSKQLAAAARSSPEASPTASARRERMAAYGKLGALVAAAVAVLSWRAMPMWRSTAETATSAPAATHAVEPAATPSAAAQSSNVAPTAPDETTGSVVAMSVDDLPSAVPVRVARPPSGLGGSAAPPSARAKTGETELELVKRAQALLASDPGGALAVTSQHARGYPSGEFVQEREVIAIEALSLLGRREESLQRACALVQRFPRTPYATRLEVAIQRPLSSISDCAAAPNPNARQGSQITAPRP